MAGAALDEVLRVARARAFGPGEFVGQESFVTRSEVLSLGRAAGIRPGVSLLDLCCGTAGPGLFLTGVLGCTYLGVDERAPAVAHGRADAAARGLRCGFEVGRVPPLPVGRFDVVLLLETLLAFSDKGSLVRCVAGVLPPGGRFAFTVEEGRPLSSEEAATMPGAGTVWVTPLAQLLAELDGAGLRVRWQQDWSGAHRVAVDALVTAYEEVAADLRDPRGREEVDALLTAHRLWGRWLRDGRVRKLALVAERPAVPDNDLVRKPTVR